MPIAGDVRIDAILALAEKIEGEKIFHHAAHDQGAHAATHIRTLSGEKRAPHRVLPRPESFRQTASDHGVIGAVR